jgi:hypothetical protein
MVLSCGYYFKVFIREDLSEDFSEDLSEDFREDFSVPSSNPITVWESVLVSVTLHNCVGIVRRHHRNHDLWRVLESVATVDVVRKRKSPANRAFSVMRDCIRCGGGWLKRRYLNPAYSYRCTVSH